MGILRNLEIMLGSIITRKVDSALYNWIEAVSQVLDGEGGPAAGVAIGAQFGITQAAWFVDPVNGNDSNDGSTLALALKTDARRQVLWGGSATAIVSQPTTITYASTPPSTDVVNFNVAYKSGGSLTIKGTPTVTKTAQALTAVTALNRATQTPFDVTAPTLDAADVGRLMRITSGARINNYCGVAKDLGGGKVRISPFGNLDVVASQTNGIPFVEVTPQVGDTVEVFTVPILTIGSFIFRSLTAVFPTASANAIFLDTIGIDGLNNGVMSVPGTIQCQGANVYLRQCTYQRVKFGGLGGVWGAGGIATNSWQVQGSFSNNGGPFAIFYGFLMTAGAFTCQAGASCWIGGDCLFQNASCQSGGNLLADFVSIFDRASANIALQVFPGGLYRSSNLASGDLLWGDGNLGTGVKVFSGAMMLYTTKPTINTPQGAGRQALIGGVNTDWAGVPVVIAANNAMIVAAA